MKGMQKIKHGSGFRGVLNYAAERDSPGSEPGRLIGGNMAGTTPRELASEFGAIRNLRPEIEKPVWHQSLRLPKDDKLSDEEWVKFADDYMQRMKFDDDHARTYWLHDDADGQHIHIVACRVSLAGKVHDSSHQSMRSTPILGQMEHDYKLTLTPGPDVDQDGKIIRPARAKPGKGEIEQALRTGDEPPKQKLQRIIDAAKADKPTALQFAERLEAAGVTPLANLASTGKLNGFSFEIDGIAFKGSQLGKAYGWGSLSKEVIYEQTTDREALERYSAAARRREIGQGSTASDRDNAAPGTDAAVPRRPSIPARTAGAGLSVIDGRIPGRDNQGRESGDQGSGDAGRVSQAPDPRNEEIGNVVPAIGRIDKGTSQGTASPAVASRFSFKPDNVGSYDRVLDLAGSFVDNPNRQKKHQAWQQQHAALQAPAYRVTLTARRESLKTYNLGKGKADDGSERTYSAREVADLIPTLARQNSRGYDVYITPIDSQYHYLVVDDMTPATVDLLKRSGYAPCLVQTSSQGNCQSIIKAPKHADGGKDEQSHANNLVQYLNKELGDPKFTGVIHPFRMAGFSNKKEGRNDFFTRMLDAGHRVCGKAAAALDELRERLRKRLQEAQDAKTQADAAKAHQRQTMRLDALQEPGGNHQDKLCKEAYQAVLRQVQGAGWTLDMSKVDYRVAKSLLARGLSDGTVERLLMEHSPSLYERHSNGTDYARRTVEAADQALAVERSETRHRPFNSRSGYDDKKGGSTIARPKG